jgi:hypothetical protein
MFDNFLLSVVSQWYSFEGYEELHFMHLQQHSIGRLLFVRGLTALSWSVGSASRTKRMASAKSLFYYTCFRFVRVNEEAYHQNQEHLMNWHHKFEALCHVSA